MDGRRAADERKERVRLRLGEGLSSVLSEFTITHGYADFSVQYNGGGIHIFGKKSYLTPFPSSDGRIDIRALTARKKPMTGCLRLAHPIYWRHGITGRRG